MDLSDSIIKLYDIIPCFTVIGNVLVSYLFHYCGYHNFLHQTRLFNITLGEYLFSLSLFSSFGIYIYLESFIETYTVISGNISMILLSLTLFPMMKFFSNLLFLSIHNSLYHIFIASLFIISSIIHAILVCIDTDDFYTLIDYTIELPIIPIAGFISIICTLLSSIILFCKNKCWNVFYYLHIILVILTTISAIIHVSESYHILLSTIILFTLDVIIRLFQIRKVHIYSISYDNNCVRLKAMKNFNYRAGSISHICVPEINYEFHPFSVSTSPKEVMMTFHIKTCGNWTENLHTLALKKADDNIEKQMLTANEIAVSNFYIYVTSFYKYYSFDLKSVNSLYLISGGIGLTPNLSLYKDIYLHQIYNGKKYGNIEKVILIWITKNNNILFKEELNAFMTYNILKDNFQVQIYEDQRPDLNNVLSTLKGNKIGVCVCGPSSLTQNVKNIALSKNYYIHEENFSF